MLVNDQAQRPSFFIKELKLTANEPANIFIKFTFICFRNYAAIFPADLINFQLDLDSVIDDMRLKNLAIRKLIHGAQHNRRLSYKLFYR